MRGGHVGAVRREFGGNCTASGVRVEREVKTVVGEVGVGFG